MKTLDFIQASISHNLRDPHSKALEPDCLSPSAFNYDTVPGGEGGHSSPQQSWGVFWHVFINFSMTAILLRFPFLITDYGGTIDFRNPDPSPLTF
jgi:hypothetical protein